MKKKEIILKPKKSIGTIVKQLLVDKNYIQKTIQEGNESQLKGKYKFVKSL